MKNSSKSQKHWLILESFFATTLVFITIWLLELLVVNIRFFDPFEKAFHDFHYFDIYYSRLKGKSQVPDTNIVIISTDTLDRKEIAMLLHGINQYDPKVVGIDVLFRTLKDPKTDSMLRSELQGIHNLVMPGYIEESSCGKITGFVASHPYFGNNFTGHVNFTGCDPVLSTIRSYKPQIVYGKDTFRCFGSDVARLFLSLDKNDPRMTDQGEQIIHYRGNFEHFLTLSGSKALSDPDQLKIVRDKIVLIGHYFPDDHQPLSFEDKFFTPLNPKVSGRSLPDMYGVIVQANIVSMIIHGDHIRLVPRIWEWIISFIICMMLVMFFLFLYHHYHPWYAPAGKIIQLVCAVILLFLVMWIYDTWNTRFDPLLLFVAIILSAEVLYFYHFIRKMINKVYEVKGYLYDK